jgi:outer membrane scaffolding protein for murein synthesis (MipA/OmpV family)
MIARVVLVMALASGKNIANVSAELLGDVGNSKGSRKLQWIGDSRWSVRPHATMGVEWYDSKFVDYYYGVKASEAVVGRSAYQGKSQWRGSGLRIDYSPARQHNLYLDFGITQFGSAIKDSPLVEKANQSTVSPIPQILISSVFPVQESATTGVTPDMKFETPNQCNLA